MCHINLTQCAQNSFVTKVLNTTPSVGWVLACPNWPEKEQLVSFHPGAEDNLLLFKSPTAQDTIEEIAHSTGHNLTYVKTKLGSLNS